MILDTDFVIDLMKKEENAVAKQQKLDEDHEVLMVTAPTIFELWTGVALLEKQDSEKSKLLSTIGNLDTLPFNQKTAEKAGEIHGSLIKAGQEIDAVDCMIASISLLENEPLLTRNAKHFTRIRGLKVEVY